MAYKQIRRRMKQEATENEGATHEVHHAPDLSQIQTDRNHMTADDALALQDVIGNRATGQIMGATSTLPPPPRMGYVQPKPIPRQPIRPEGSPNAPAYAHLRSKLAIQPKLSVGAVHDPSEQEADRVASQVIDGASPDHQVQAKSQIQRASWEGSFETNNDFESQVNQQSGGGKPLPSDVRADLEPKFGADFSGVKVHADAKAAQLSQDVGAQAFTHGSDIYFNQGKYNPNSGSGKHLLAHELTHTVQQGAATVSRQVIQRDIDPNVYETFKGQGAKVDGKKDALTGSHRQLLKQLKEYIQKQNTKNTKWKEQTLQSIQSKVMAWLINPTHQQEVAENDRNAVKRNRAMLYLLPIIRRELTLVNPSYTEKNEISTGERETAGGVMNEVTMVEFDRYIGDSNTNKGVFIKPPDQLMEGSAGRGSGIPANNPNLGNRAIASSRLAKLFGTKVIAETVPTTFNGYEGIVQERAGGVAPVGEESAPLQDQNFGKNAVEAGVPGYHEKNGIVYKVTQVANRIDWTDPALLKQMVELQFMDLIAGQVDRHAGNYKVEQGQNGTMVKGFDLDQSFGKDKGVAKMDSTDKTSQQLPPVVHKDFAERIMNVTEGQVRQVLTGLISQEEIEATVLRLAAVKDHLVDLFGNGGWVDGYTPTEAQKFTDKNSYIGRDKSFQEGMGQRGLLRG